MYTNDKTGRHVQRRPIWVCTVCQTSHLYVWDARYEQVNNSIANKTDTNLMTPLYEPRIEKKKKKSVFWVCDQVRLKLACSASQAS